MTSDDASIEDGWKQMPLRNINRHNPIECLTKQFKRTNFNKKG